MSDITSTSTVIQTGIGMTNIIRNTINLGGQSLCDSGPQYCDEGYGLYFPCLKSITKGQDVCLEFYVTDNALKDVADLRDVDAITLSLIGAFNCPFGDYSYPENISSLQREEYNLKYSNDFGNRNMCHLSVEPVYTDDEPGDMESIEGYFDSGTEVSVAAYDTYTHIFLGWIVADEEVEDCDDETIDDILKSTENIFTFTIESDMTVFAVYRERKTYTIQIDDDNVNSHFNIMYYGAGNPDNVTGWYPISNREDEIFDDGYDHVDVLEGYHFKAVCIPNIITLDSLDSSEDDYMYRFVKWDDGYDRIDRVFVAGVDTGRFSDGTIIFLKAICEGPVDVYEPEFVSPVVPVDSFDEMGIHILTDQCGDSMFYDYSGDDGVESYNNVRKCFIGDEGYLYMNYGNIIIESDIEEGIKIDIAMKAYDEECEVIVKSNGNESVQVITPDDFYLYSFYFRENLGSSVEIVSNGECLIDSIEIYEEVIIDKGKAEFCIDSSVTSDLPSGKLSAGGAIAVNGTAYGLPVTQIGEVNRLNKINII